MAKTTKPIAKQFIVKEGCVLQHEGIHYVGGAIAPFNSDDVDLVLFHAANIAIVEPDQGLDPIPEKTLETPKFTEDKL
jgi:hypothetical protein